MVGEKPLVIGAFIVACDLSDGVGGEEAAPLAVEHEDFVVVVDGLQVQRLADACRHRHRVDRGAVGLLRRSGQPDADRRRGQPLRQRRWILVELALIVVWMYAALFVLDLVVPDVVPFYDEVLLALATLHVWRKPLPVVLREEVMEPIGASSTWRLSFV